MIRLLRGSLARLFALGAIALVVLAVLITGVRLVLPAADEYRGQIAAALSERLGLPVRMQRLQIGLAGLSPRLTLDDVALADPAGGPDILSLRALELDLDLLASLRLGSPQIRAATLVGARLVIQRRADGRIQIRGLGALQSDDPRALARFLRQGRLNLVESEVSLLDDRIPGWRPRLDQVQLRMSNQGQAHRFHLRARPVPRRPAAGSKGDGRLSVIADLRGDGADPGRWGGRLYLALRGAGGLALLPPSLADLWRVRAGELLAETWLRLDGGRLDSGLGRVAAEGLRLVGPALARESRDPASEGGGAPPAAPEIRVDRLSALARLTPTETGWQVGVRDLRLAVAGAEAAVPGLDLGLSPEGRLERLSLAADRFDLPLAGTLLRLYPAPLPQAARRLAALDPSGRLERVAFALEGHGTQTPRWRLAARGRALGIARVDRIPGVCGLDLRVRANQDGGELRLGSDWLNLDLAPLFDRSLYLDRFSGFLSWTSGPEGGLRLTGRNLILENPDLAGRVRFTLDLPAAAPTRGAVESAGPFVDLRASFHDGDGSRARTYLPVGIMSPRLVEWLERALVGGRVPQADLILRGPLRDYPFRERQGRFELLLEIAGAGLDYREGWPPIEDANGALHLVDQGLEVHIDSGRILDSDLTAGLARIPDLRGARRLAIHGEAEGPLSDGLRVLGETPLAEHLGHLAENLRVSGTSKLTLDLAVPLTQGEPLGLEGHLTLPGPTELAIAGTPITVTDLAGELQFTQDTVSAQAAQARLWGLPLDLRVATQGQSEPAGALTQIRARAQTPVSVLAEHLPSPVWSVARGEAEWDLTLDLPSGDPRRKGSPIQWRLRSDLRGLALDPPPPLGKPATQARVLDLAGALRLGQSLNLSGSVGDLGLDLAMDLTRGSPRVEGGRVVIGARGATPGGAALGPGLRVQGSLEALDLAAWGGWWARFRGGRNGGASGEGPGALVLPEALDLELKVARLGLGAAALRDARIRLVSGEGGSRVELDSRELAGQLTLPAGVEQVPVQLDLARLDAVSLMPSGGPQRASPGPPRLEGRFGALPAMDIRVADLRWDDEGLGRLRLDLRPEPSGLGVRRIELQGPGDTRAQGEADWVEGLDGGRSRLSLAVSSADTGPLMGALDYRSVLSQAPLESRVLLDWPGGLESFDLARSSGTIDLKVGAGRLLEVEPGVGRVFGILNLGALSRRLALDFTDLYQQGFSFEQIQGDIRIGGGRAELRRFEIDGPSSTIRVGGLTDLRSRTFDQTVTVEPRIGSSVALASALAGGPVVGAAVYLADKVTGGAIDRLGAYRYRITGPWADPELTRLAWDPFANPVGPDSPTGRAGQAGGVTSPDPSEQNHFLD